MTALIAVVLSLQEESIDALIERLGSERIEDREVAAANLRKLGERAVPALRRARRSVDAERRGRAEELLAGRGIRIVAPRSCDPADLTRLLRDLFEGVEGLEIAFDARTSTVSLRGRSDSLEIAREVVILVDQDAFEAAGGRKPPYEALFQDTGKVATPDRK